MSFLTLIPHFKGRTISGDSTTNKHINFEFKCGLFVVPDYDSSPRSVNRTNIPTQRFYSVTSSVDHRSETQFKGWMDLIKWMAEEYNASSMGHLNPFDVREFTRSVVGMNTDHTKDQKKLVLLCSMEGECQEGDVWRGEDDIYTTGGITPSAF